MSFRLRGGTGAGAAAGPARGALAVDREVADIRLEPMVFIQGAHQGAYRVRGNLGDAAAAGADQVDVVGFRGEVVAGGAVPEVRVGDQAQLLQQFQRAVDGGDVTPLAVCCTSAQISSGLACSSLVTASSTSCRWGVTR